VFLRQRVLTCRFGFAVLGFAVLRFAVLRLAVLRFAVLLFAVLLFVGILVLVDFRVFLGLFLVRWAVFRLVGLFGLLDSRADEFAGLFHQFPQLVPQRIILGENFGDQVACTLQHIGDGRHALLGVDEFGGSGLQISNGGLRGDDLVGQRIQAAAASQSGERLLFGLEGQIQIFQSPQRVGGLDAGDQIGRRSSLRLERFEYPLLAIGQNAQPTGHFLDSPNLFFVESTGLIFPVSRDKRNRIAIIQQLDRDLNSVQGQSDFTRHLP